MSPCAPALQVPDGAPARVREGEVPPADQDTKFSYLWNCRAWLDQASKVVIATGEPALGRSQHLAELAPAGPV